jgi:hypothetical protein
MPYVDTPTDEMQLQAVGTDDEGREVSDVGMGERRNKGPLTCENDESGGSKNRTCDLSIISAAL